MIHSTETGYNSKFAIKLDGYNFATSNGPTDLIEMSRDLYHGEATSSLRSRNLVGRVGHTIPETIPPTQQQNLLILFPTESFTGTNQALSIRHANRGSTLREGAYEVGTNPKLILASTYPRY